MTDDNLPSSVEQFILGAILSRGSAWDMVADRLKPSHFNVSIHQRIFEAMKSLARKNEPIDIITVDDEMRLLKINDAGSFAYIAELAHNSTGCTNIVAYAKILERQSTIGQLRETAFKMQAITEEAIEPSEMIDKSEHLLFNIRCVEQRGGGLKDIKSLMANFFNSLDSPLVNVISTGFTALDNLMAGGMRPGELIVLAGRPGMGKTTLGMNIAQHVAFKLGLGVFVFSMEMPDYALTERMFASMAQIDLTRIRLKDLHEYEWARVEDVVKMINLNTMRIDDTSQMRPSEMRSRVRRESRIAGLKPLSLIVVDYLQLMRSDSKYDLRANEIGECSGSLKALAKEMGVPVIALAQLNRNSLGKTGDARKPNMADLRESGSIEQDADMVALIYRDDVYNKESKERGFAEIIVDKNRNGETGDFQLIFDGRHNRFLNVQGI